MVQSQEPEPLDGDFPRPWLKSYDEGVPSHLDYPRVPLWQLLDQSAGRYPDKPCTYFFGRETSYRQIEEGADRFAAGLIRLGVARGDRVALLLPNCPQFVIAYYGLLKAGAVAVLLNPLLTEAELNNQLRQSDTGTLVTIPLFLAKARGAGQDTGLRRIICARLADALPLPARLVMAYRERVQAAEAGRIGQPGKAAVEVGMSELLAQPAPVDFQPITQAPDDLAVLIYSGGTTGASKGVALSHFNLVANAYQIIAWGHMLERRYEDARILAVLPLFHGFGMSVTMNAPIASGYEMVLVPRFNARDVLKTIQKTRPRFMIGVPTMFAAFNRVPGIARFDLKGIEGIFVGAAPLTKAIKEQFESATGARMLEGYGLTESVTAIMANPLRGRHKLGSIGLPFSDTDVKITGIEDGRDLPPGELGEIALRGPTVMLRYEGDPATTAGAIVEGGWLRTGDIGYMDEDGYFYITDRKKELIKVSGFNVFPREVDEVIHSHPQVQEGICVGLPDPYKGERIKAFVVLKPGATATAEELLAHFRERLATYKVPSEVEFRAELPKSIIGKVLRRQLKEEALRREGAS